MPPIRRETDDEVDAVRLIEAAFSDSTPTATHYRDMTKAEPTGAPPVLQPGRPPMSQRATDISVMTLAVGASSLPIGGAAALVLSQLAHVPPGVLALAALSPLGLFGGIAVAAKALGRAAHDAAEAAPREEHHHYEGPTNIQRTDVHTTTRGLGRTHNQLPPHPRD